MAQQSFETSGTAHSAMEGHNLAKHRDVDGATFLYTQAGCSILKYIHSRAFEIILKKKKANYIHCKSA
jgi:hypothetical protein